MKNTAMQELLDIIFLDRLSSVLEIIDQANRLLEKEKEQIEDSFFEGQDGRYSEFDNYYKETYKK
jgi:uncharacterized membrane protein (UPF0127 family)